MIISELPIELQKLVHANQIAQGQDGDFKGELACDTGRGNFTWIDSPEGRDFWNDVDDGRDVTDSPHYPHQLTENIITNFPIY